MTTKVINGSNGDILSKLIKKTLNIEIIILPCIHWKKNNFLPKLKQNI